jgi:hypothetical protein
VREGAQPVAGRGSDRLELGDILPDLNLTVQRLFEALRHG